MNVGEPVRYGAVVSVVDGESSAVAVDVIDAVLVIRAVRVDVDVIVWVFE